MRQAGTASLRGRPGSARGAGLAEDEDFSRFLNRTAPSRDEVKEHVFDKVAGESWRKEATYTATHISIARPDPRLELVIRDTRNRTAPGAARAPALGVLSRPLRCLDRSGLAPPGHPSDVMHNEAASRAPPQPVPQATQKQETEFVQTIEESLQQGELAQALWDQYARRAEELLITMPLEKVLRVLKAFVLANYRGSGLFLHIGGELAKEAKNASTVRLCQIFHWISRAGLRDQTLMQLLGNETLLRFNDDLVFDMLLEILNVHAKLDLKSPRLISAILRELGPACAELTVDQCCAVAPLTVMNILDDRTRGAYLARCAELDIGRPVAMTKPAVLRQFRLLADCLSLDYHPGSPDTAVQTWVADLKAEGDAQDRMEATPLSAIEEDILRVLREEMGVAVTPTLQDGILSVHLVMGRTALEIMDSKEDYYFTPAMNGQRLLKAETKLRQRLLWRRGFRVITLDEGAWSKLTDDIHKKDLLEDLLVSGQRAGRR